MHNNKVGITILTKVSQSVGIFALNMSTVDVRWGQLFSQKSHRGVPIFTVDIFTLNMSTVDISGDNYSHKSLTGGCPFSL